MTNEEFNIKFQEAISELGEDYASDLLQRLQRHQDNPSIYVSKEYYDIIKKREESKLDEN